MLKAIHLHHLNLTSWVIFAVGIAALVLSPVFGWSDVVQLTGLLLIICGLVKVAVVWVWKSLAHMETDRHDPIPPV